MVLGKQVNPGPRGEYWKLESRDQLCSELLEGTGEADAVTSDDHRTLGLRRRDNTSATFPGSSQSSRPESALAASKPSHARRVHLRGLRVERRVDPHRTATWLSGEMDSLLQMGSG